MKVKVKQIATVQVGYTFRSRLEPSRNGTVAIIQMKDLADDNTVACDGLTKIELEKVKEKHLVEQKDLIFRSRGLVSTSAVLLNDPGNAIVAAPLLRIRVEDVNKVMPEYLNWYINQNEAQAFLNSRAKGTTQKMISKQAIEDLEIRLPALSRQRDIIELASLSAQENVLLQRLERKKEQYISMILMQYATGE